MSKGPLAVSWGAPPRVDVEAGTRPTVAVQLANDGDLPWRDGVFLASHWLDDRDNPILWDGPRNDVPALGAGEQAVVDARLRVPIPPGRYRLAFDMVAEHRAWFSELGSPMLRLDVDVRPRTAEPNATLPPTVDPAPDWAERVRAAHADGYAVVAGAVEWPRRARPREAAAYAPGPGRVPGFSAPLLAPSVAAGVDLEPLGEIGGLPAFAAPHDDPWVYDGRIVLRVR